MSLTNSLPELVAEAASISALKLARLPAEARNNALTAIHDALYKAKNEILAANAKDLIAASKAAENGELSPSLVKRLDLSRNEKWEDMLKGIRDVRNLPDPIGKVISRMQIDDGLVCDKVTCPLGVLLIIFEARPEVIANISSLAIKSGNAAILKGGKESTESFIAISTVISRALASTEVPNDSIQLVTGRTAIDPLLVLDNHIDLIIPRGSNELVRYIKDHTKIPVMGHADGLCSMYICSDVDMSGAMRLVLDAKLGYPAACNSIETLLVDEDALSTVFLPIAEALLKEGVSLLCDDISILVLTQTLDEKQAALLFESSADDYDTEFLDLKLAIKTVPRCSSPIDALELAVAHINTHGSHHTDAILTSSQDRAEIFMDAVDSAGVYWNTSTRMADGMRYGFGTEVGISTGKLHARGPVGLEGLTTYKYKIRGRMQAAGDYGNTGLAFKHQVLSVD